MQQQLPGANRIVVVAIALLVRRDVHSVEEHFALPEPGVGFLDGCLAAPERLDLGTGQHDAAFPGLENVVIVGRLGIAGDALFTLGWRGRIAGHVTILSKG